MGTATMGPGVGTAIGAGVGSLFVLGGEGSRRGWWANGGTLPHGYANGGPILVGERGPELIVPPRMGGQVLNTDRTRNLLRGQQSGMAGGNGMVQTLIVSNIVAQSSTSQNSKIAIDSFAGVA
jgi:phage-related minor tail protein